jgi:hypothetical protein
VNDVRIFCERKVNAYIMNNTSKVSLFQRELMDLAAWFVQHGCFIQVYSCRLFLVLLEISINDHNINPLTPNDL